MVLAAEYPGVPRIVFGELQRNEASASRHVVQNLLRQYGQRLQQWLPRASPRPGPGTDLAAASALLVGMVQGLVMQSVLQVATPNSMRTQAPAVFALYRRAIAAPPAVPCPRTENPHETLPLQRRTWRCWLCSCPWPGRWVT